MKTHPYFDNSVRTRRPEITVEMCEHALRHPQHIEVQSDGRVRYWVYIEELNRYLRVVTFEDGDTVYNAFFDRGYRP